MASFNIEMVLRLVDKASAPLRKIKGGVVELSRTVARADYAGMAERVEGVRERQRGAALETAALGFSLAQALRPAIAFEGAMAEVAKVVDFDRPEGLKLLGDDVLRLSTEIPIAAEGLADIVAAAARGGVVDALLPDDQFREGLIAFTSDAAQMATAFGISAGQAGDALAKLRNTFGLTQAEAMLAVDAMNLLGNSMATNEPDILNATQRAGSLGQMIGFTVPQISGLSAAMLAMGTPAEVTGNALGRLFQIMGSPGRQSERVTNALAEIGLSAKDMRIAVEEDAQGALIRLLELADSHDDTIGILTDIFGTEFNDEIAKLASRVDLVQEAFGHVGDQAQYAGAMTREYQKRIVATDKQLALLQNNVSRVAIAAGEALLPAIIDLTAQLVPFLDQAAAWAQANPELIRSIISITAALVAFKAVMFLIGTPILMLVSGGFRLIAAFKSVLGVLRLLLLVGGPLRIAFLAIAALVTLLYNTWGPFRDWIDALWAGVQDIFRAAAMVLDGIVTADFAKVVDGFKALFTSLGAFFTTLFEGIKATVQGTANAIMSIIQPVIDFFDTSQAAAAVAGPRGELGRRASRRVRPIEGRFAGGPVLPGRQYLVGELGPELLTIGSQGFITPNDVLIDNRPPMAPSTAPAAASFNVTFNISGEGQDPAAIAREVRRQIESVMDGQNDLHDGAFYGGA